MTLVSCRQLAPRVGLLRANVEASIDAVASAVDEGAAVIVLPELVTSGYMFESNAEAAAMAVTPDDAVFAAWAAEAARTDAVVIGGFCERAGDGRLFNSAAVVDREGVRAVYRKTHLWDREKLWFEPGPALPPVVDTAAGRIGVAICYDVEFPEVTRHLALAGADVIAVPTNWPLVERPAGEHPPEVVIAMAAARVNHLAIACCDRTGTERGQEWTAGTAIVGADGWLLAVAGDHDVATADVVLEASRDKRVTDLSHPLDDRRTDLYRSVTAPLDA
jgi:5-aminopentanamidase